MELAVKIDFFEYVDLKNCYIEAKATGQKTVKPRGYEGDGMPLSFARLIIAYSEDTRPEWAQMFSDIPQLN